MNEKKKSPHSAMRVFLNSISRGLEGEDTPESKECRFLVSQAEDLLHTADEERLVDITYMSAMVGLGVTTIHEEQPRNLVVFLERLVIYLKNPAYSATNLLAVYAFIKGVPNGED